VDQEQTTEPSPLKIGNEDMSPNENKEAKELIDRVVGIVDQRRADTVTILIDKVKLIKYNKC
jgi:hypothetical protein